MALFAHIQHWLWVLYLPPGLIVAVAVTTSKLRERRERSDPKTDRSTD